MPLSDGIGVLLTSRETQDGFSAPSRRRYCQIRRVLGESFSATAIGPFEKEGSDWNGAQGPGGARGVHTDATVPPDVRAIFVDGRMLPRVSFPKKTKIPLAIDLYDPWIADDQANRCVSAQDSCETEERNALIREQLVSGDFFVCANESQRDYWLGMLTACNRINPIVYAEDRTMSNLLSVLPWGISDTRFENAGRVLRGVLPGILERDVVAVWALDDLSWLDPIVFIQALDRLDDVEPSLKAVFLLRNSTNVDPDGSVASVQKVSGSLGLTNKCVFFVNYDVEHERDHYFREADFGVSLQKRNSFAAQLAARPEIPAYVGAGLPVLASPYNAKMILDYSLGRVILEESVEGVVRALRELLAIPDLRESFSYNVQRAVRELSWEKASLPLLQWCKRPSRAADSLMGLRSNEHGVVENLSPTTLLALPGLALHYLRMAGVSGLAEETRSYLRWKLANYWR